ncbi:hypothetical protein EUX98_g3878 [Antrodiella citrinella]|uniref:Heterokaryon incompatibility domain-containing protein n=1 Tax=Antrodiella citrinella TaxID=2447956 RepID=A0A4S4MXX2_9APHY|nr:hypothetical protein EUX98_g3878 [Antrodiella citrinella]
MDFRLLVKQPTGSDSSQPSITLEGNQWFLSESLNIDSDSIPKYACVSYVWGPGRLANPIHSSVLMSDRTLTVLCAAIRNSHFDAFWIDAFCVPVDPVYKGPTLESMGYIYAQALKVIAVLAPRSFAAIQQMTAFKKGDAISSELLDDMEREVWINSVWTYQEVVNSTGMFFVGEDTADGNMLDCAYFLNGIGYYMAQYSKAFSLTVFEMRKRYPKLDTFEDLAADWMMAGYTERSALEIMSNMGRRVFDDPKNYFYSMIGALTQKPSQRSKKPSVETLAESFMAVAEEKGDYSFVFSSAPRDERPGLEWRPRPQLLRAGVTWRVDGEMLKGTKEPGGIRLHEIVVVHPGEAVGLVARSIIYTWMNALELESEPDAVIAIKMRELLKFLGFTGTGRTILTEHGFAYPQEEVPEGAAVEVWLATGVYYLFGAPAMIVAHVDDTARYIPAVFAGSGRWLEGRTDVFIPMSSARL